MKITELTLVILLLAAGPCALAIDLYVDPVNGDDANDGLSWEAALKTITAAGQIADGRDCVEVFLAEGIYSEDNGESFPIYLPNIVDIHGSSMDKTVIESGDSIGILRISEGCTDLDLHTIRFESFTISRSHPVPFDEFSDPDMIEVFEGGVTMELHNIRLLNLCSERQFDRPKQAIVGGMTYIANFYSCEFVNCNGHLFLYNHEYDDDGTWDIDLADCLFTYDEILGEADRALVIEAYHTVSMRDCRFSTSEDYLLLRVFGGYRCEVRNNIFDGIDLSTGCAYDRVEYLGSTFADCYMKIIEAWRNTFSFRACLFDDECVLDLSHAGLYSDHSRLPLILNQEPGQEFSIQNAVEGEPMLVSGPLGDSYLSNEAAGQEFTSPCVGAAETSHWYGAWPPTGSTTRTDGVPDEAPYDIGYHYPSVPPPPPAVDVRTDKSEYAAGEEMTFYPSYENRGVKVEGAIYFAFTPENLTWLVYWPWMTFIPTPYVEGTLYSGVSYPNLPPTSHTIPEGLAAGTYYWLGAVVASDGSFTSDIAIWPVSITAD